MWFKQATIFELPKELALNAEALDEQLAPLAFTPCLPSLPTATGFIPPLEVDGEELRLARSIRNYTLFCLQCEDKILPASVIKQTVDEKIKVIQAREDRKIRQKEKLSLKDEATMTLLPRAFSRLTKVHAYVDTDNNWLVINTTSVPRLERFIGLLKKAFHDDIELKRVSVEHIASTMTRWLTQRDYPDGLDVEKNAVFQDPQQQNRVIRCQQQDLFVSSIQSLMKDGCQVKQLTLTWHDQITFVLTDTLHIQSVRFADELISAAKETATETQQQQFDTDFMIMSQSLSHLIKTVLEALTPVEAKTKEKALEPA